MTLLEEKIHLLNTQKHDVELDKQVSDIIEQYEPSISAELSAFFVGHSIDGYMNTNILKTAPKTSDISKLKQWVKPIHKINEKQVNKRKLAYVSLGLADMEMYIQSMVGLLLLPTGMYLYQMFTEELSKQFTDECQRQGGQQRGLKSDVAKRLSKISFNDLKPEQAFWKSFDLTVANLSLELNEAVKQGVSSQEWQKIVGG
ncbi:hypothetical protein IV73_GL000162 [Weissella kandleri]|uniref:Uncharacterized protein n=1 Tax=Weissella kandleri TaxID=1616 RepID=A0A0R2JNG9_9LACO|nr:hypothetical protein [Weissella kandleri]KRN75668.1 hypothetical protein IV73_GL000162 [Weissella kandleri]